MGELTKKLGVSRQAHHQWQARQLRQRQLHQQVLELVRNRRKRLAYEGVHKLYDTLKAKLKPLGVGRDQLWQLLQQHDMLTKQPAKSGPSTTDGARVWYKNLLQLQRISRPNQAWVADISYVRTLGGFCYMALISDVYSRKIVGWDLSDTLELKGALAALKMALKQLPKGQKVIHHSDRGSQYRSKAYLQQLRKRHARVSMTERDHCAENAQAERLNGILKQEFGMGMVFINSSIAKYNLKQAVYLFNNERAHSSLNKQRPEHIHQAI